MGTPNDSATSCAGLCTAAGLAAAHRDHGPRMLARARASLDDRQLAEDAVQEAFTRAWSACSTFDPHAGPPLVVWLLTITRNVVIDMVRARAVRPRVHARPADDVAAERIGAADSADRVVLRMALLDALAGVSSAQRAVVLRTVLHDRPYADVAAELRIPVGTVKSRTFHALRRMRTDLHQGTS